MNAYYRGCEGTGGAGGTIPSLKELFYITNDINQSKKLLNSMYRQQRSVLPEITNVIFNAPATIVFWSDGTKTVVKAQDECFDQEKGLSMAIAKKALGNKGNYFNEIKKWLPEEKECIGDYTIAGFEDKLNKAFRNLFGGEKGEK